DVDLLEGERCPLAFGENDLARLVTEPAAWPRVHPHPAHRGGWYKVLVQEEDRQDLALHGRLALGDRAAFEDLYRKYAPAAHGLALRVTGQEALAQEVVHDAFLALWRAPEAYDPGRGPFRTFFLSLVHHRAVDTVRREDRLR